MLALSLISVPSASSSFTQIGAWSAPMFEELLPIAFIVVGILAGGLIVLFLMNAITGAFERFVWGRASRGDSWARDYVSRHPDHF